MLRLRYTQRLEGVQESLDALENLALRSLRQMRSGAGFPKLYASGVRYKREPAGVENWQTARELFATGFGDCEDLATVRVAELRHGGERAKIVLRTVRPGLVHILVKRANGKLEDPSKVLGMKGAG